LSEVFHRPEEPEILNNDVTDPGESHPRETNLKSASASPSMSNGVEKEPSNNIIDYLPFPEKKKKDISRDKKRKLKKFRKPSFIAPLLITFT
jgi:hypothetical protein